MSYDSAQLGAHVLKHSPEMAAGHALVGEGAGRGGEGCRFTGWNYIIFWIVRLQNHRFIMVVDSCWWVVVCRWLDGWLMDGHWLLIVAYEVSYLGYCGDSFVMRELCVMMDVYWWLGPFEQQPEATIIWWLMGKMMVEEIMMADAISIDGS